LINISYTKPQQSTASRQWCSAV